MRNLRIFLLLTACVTAGTISAEVMNWLGGAGQSSASANRAASTLSGPSNRVAAEPVEPVIQAGLSPDGSRQVRASES